MTSTTAALLPTAVALSGEDAINAILSDIPLFCEGVLGIGVLTYFFMTRQVKIPSLFLYASCFLAFGAATLDLSQILLRRLNSKSKAVSLESIAAFIYAREVFISLSYFALGLYLWRLVSFCPRGERTENPNELSTSKSRPGIHSASWDRWGITGTILKYGSLAALLATPLLSMLWRLMPAQRTYSSTYIAESIVQTAVVAVFLLKLLLNISVSPLKPWWRAPLYYAVPIASLIIGLILGVGNVILFSFTETALGRFLLAVEVYLLIVHNLFNSFNENQQHSTSDITAPPKPPLEKSEYFNLPISFPVANSYGVSPRSTPTNRLSVISWITSRIALNARIRPPSQVPIVPPSSFPEDTKNVERQATYSSSSEIRSLSPRDVKTRSVDKTIQTSARASMSLSYYGMDSSNLFVKEENVRSEGYAPPLGAEYMRKEDHNANSSIQGDSSGSAGSAYGSISSIDQIIREQNELDRTIVALRLVSMSVQPDESKVLKDNDQSRSTLVSSKTESYSNRSDFSLSVFPEPPVIPTSDAVTKHASSEARQLSKQRKETRKGSVDNARPNGKISAERASPRDGQLSASVQRNSPVTSYDVTSFIGNLSKPLIANAESDAESTPRISTAQLGSAVGLRPMILSTSLMASSSSPVSSYPYREYSEEQRVSASSNEPLPLRPLLLGNTSIQSASMRMSSKVPLAQRRKRGGTIASDTRRPVIGVPRADRDRTEGVAGAFERPRPPPLALTK